MKRKIFVWALYDFANSFVSITFLIYFAKWIVVGQGLADWIYNATFMTSSLALIFAAPILGRKADRWGNNRKYLILTTLACCLGYGSTLVGALGGWNVLLVALLYTCGAFFYQLSFVFYNPLLANISTPKNRGTVSSMGFLAGYGGQVCAVLLSLPFVSGKVSMGIDPILATLLISTGLFFLLALPLLLSRSIFVRTSNPVDSMPNEDHIFLLKKVISISPLFFFLLSFFFFSDAVSTFVANFSIFAANVFSTTDQQIGILVLLALICAGIGSVAFGWIADRLGTAKMMAIILTCWILGISFAAVAPNYPTFFALVLFAGALAGGTWTVARALIMSLAPSSMTNYIFGLYAISERAATIVGPLVWSLVLAVGGYRWALFSLAGFQAISMYLIFRVLRMKQTEGVLVN